MQINGLSSRLTKFLLKTAPYCQLEEPTSLQAFRPQKSKFQRFNTTMQNIHRPLRFVPQYSRFLSSKPQLKAVCAVDKNKQVITNNGDLAKILKARAGSKQYEPCIVRNSGIMCSAKTPSRKVDEESIVFKQYRLLETLKGKLGEENALRQAEIRRQREAINENLKLCAEIDTKLQTFF